MPRKKSFLLVSLQENEAKKLAQIISNDTCRKILEYLGENEAVTETDLAKKLNLAIIGLNSDYWYQIYMIIPKKLKYKCTEKYCL